MWDNYTIVTNLASQPKEYKKAMFLCTICQSALDIHNLFHFNDDKDRSDIATMISKFDEDFTGEVNETYERFQFNRQTQQSGVARFNLLPENKLYIVQGETAKILWDYHVDDIKTEFNSRSPLWYFHNSSLLIGYGDSFDNRKFKIDTNSCPSRLRTPTVRVSVEGKATLVITNITLKDSGTYGCILFLLSGDLSSMPTSTSQLIVTETPKFTKKPAGSTNITEYKHLSILCVAVGTPLPNVTWKNLSNSMEPAISKGQGSAELKIESITRNYNGQKYRCEAVNNPLEGAIIQETKLIVNYPPEFTLLPINTTVTQGDNIILQCMASSNPPSNIYWEREDGQRNVRQVGTGSTLNILNVDKSNAGKYTCTANNFYDRGKHEEKAHAYVVVKYQPSIVHNSSKHTVNESDSVTLTCKADGFPVPNITWTKLWTKSVTLLSTGNNYTISQVNKSNAGNYTCAANNGIGIATAIIEVIVQYKPTINKDFSNSSVESWDGHTIKLICKWSSSNPPPNWSWSKPSGESITSSPIFHGSEIRVTTNGKRDYGPYICNATNVAGNDGHVISVTQLFPPGAPHFNVTDIKASSAVVQWMEPVDNGGSKVIEYKVEIDSKTYTIPAWKPNHFTIPTLTNNRKYVVKLYAGNVVDYGNASTRTFTTKKEGPPGSPVLEVTQSSSTTVTLSWSKPEENGGEIQHYTIYKKLVDANKWSQVGTLEGEPLTYTVKDLLPGKTYSFHVTAKNKDGSSLMDVNVKTVTLPVETTTAPTTSVIAPSKGKSSSDESDPNQPIIIAGAVVAVVLIAITAVISIVILRKKNAFGKSGKKRNSNQQTAAYHNDVDSSDSIGRGAAVVTLNDDSVPTYAAVDMTKKTKKKDEIPNYAAVDKSKKKKKPGEIIYAELADFNTNNVPAAPRPAQYTETDYADISQFQNQVEAEPTYANFPGRSKDYNI